MKQRFSAQEVRAHVASGLQAFPLTDFDEAGEFAPEPFAKRIEWMSSHNPAALYVAGGAGEFFSLTPSDYTDLVTKAVASRTNDIPLIAAAGYGTRTAIEYAKEAEKLGADGVLLLPPYLTEASQQGLYEHISRVCGSVSLPIIVYNRGNCRLQTNTLERLIDACPNLVGLKDGIGNFEELIEIKSVVGSEIALINGMPTAEIYASAFKGLGIRAYSSAVFSFCPEGATRFYNGVMQDDQQIVNEINGAFFSEYCKLRSSQPGYAVSIVKAGARITGHGAGNVRPPLSDLTAKEEEHLSRLISDLYSVIE